jgi:hypothetical protein
VAGCVRVQAVPQTGGLGDLEVFFRLFTDLPLFALIGALAGGLCALFSIACARQRERWRKEDEETLQQADKRLREESRKE